MHRGSDAEGGIEVPGTVSQQSATSSNSKSKEIFYQYEQQWLAQRLFQSLVMELDSQRRIELGHFGSIDKIAKAVIHAGSSLHAREQRSKSFDELRLGCSSVSQAVLLYRHNRSSCDPKAN